MTSAAPSTTYAASSQASPNGSTQSGKVRAPSDRVWSIVLSLPPRPAGMTPCRMTTKRSTVMPISRTRMTTVTHHHTTPSSATPARCRRPGRAARRRPGRAGSAGPSGRWAGSSRSVGAPAPPPGGRSVASSRLRDEVDPLAADDDGRHEVADLRGRGALGALEVGPPDDGALLVVDLLDEDEDPLTDALLGPLGAQLLDEPGEAVE